MGIASVRQRVDRLERTGVFARIINYPFFSRSEVAALADRLQAGRRLGSDEVKRIEFLTPVMSGELLITAYQGRVFMKRYPGIDVTEL